VGACSPFERAVKEDKTLLRIGIFSNKGGLGHADHSRTDFRPMANQRKFSIIPAEDLASPFVANAP